MVRTGDPTVPDAASLPLFDTTRAPAGTGYLVLPSAAAPLEPSVAPPAGGGVPDCVGVGAAELLAGTELVAAELDPPAVLVRLTTADELAGATPTLLVGAGVPALTDSYADSRDTRTATVLPDPAEEYVQSPMEPLRANRAADPSVAVRCHCAGLVEAVGQARECRVTGLAPVTLASIVHDCPAAMRCASTVSPPRKVSTPLAREKPSATTPPGLIRSLARYIVPSD
jgi:hypothetical protein